MVKASDLAGLRVLVIEDESMVTMLLEDTLAEIGCEVVGLASQLEDAIALVKSLSLDLAVLDINLDGRQSLPIAEELAARGIPFVVSTGYDAKAVSGPMAKAPLLQKPFRRQDLERALMEALTGSERLQGP